jgi:hypothetical protein
MKYEKCDEKNTHLSEMEIFKRVIYSLNRLRTVTSVTCAILAMSRCVRRSVSRTLAR